MGFSNFDVSGPITGDYLYTVICLCDVPVRAYKFLFCK